MTQAFCNSVGRFCIDVLEVTRALLRRFMCSYTEACVTCLENRSWIVVTVHAIAKDEVDASFD